MHFSLNCVSQRTTKSRTMNWLKNGQVTNTQRQFQNQQCCAAQRYAYEKVWSILEILGKNKQHPLGIMWTMNKGVFGFLNQKLFTTKAPVYNFIIYDFLLKKLLWGEKESSIVFYCLANLPVIILMLQLFLSGGIIISPILTSKGFFIYACNEGNIVTYFKILHVKIYYILYFLRKQLDSSHWTAWIQITCSIIYLRTFPEVFRAFEFLCLYSIFCEQRTTIIPILQVGIW